MFGVAVDNLSGSKRAADYDEAVVRACSHLAIVTGGGALMPGNDHGVQSALEQRCHAGRHSGAFDAAVIGALEDQMVDHLVQLQELGNGEAAAIAGLAARHAADRMAQDELLAAAACPEIEAADQFRRCRRRTAARGAEAAGQTLCQDAAQDGGQQIILHPHIVQPSHRGGGLVCRVDSTLSSLGPGCSGTSAPQATVGASVPSIESWT
jgi:hypothetical protein